MVRTRRWSSCRAEQAPPFRDLLISLLGRLADLAPELAVGARVAAKRLGAMRVESQFEPSRHPPRQSSDELRAILDAPLTAQRSGEELVARVLRDL
jgi:hypothetical protein